MGKERGAGPGWPIRYPQLHHREWLRARLAEGMSASQIADQIGCTLATVYTALTRAKLREVVRGDAVVFSAEYILSCASRVKSFNQLARALEVTRPTLQKIIVRADLQPVQVEERFVPPSRAHDILAAQKRERAEARRQASEKRDAEMERLYVTEGLLMREVGQRMGFDIAFVSRKLKARGVVARTRKR